MLVTVELDRAGPTRVSRTRTPRSRSVFARAFRLLPALVIVGACSAVDVPSSFIPPDQYAFNGSTVDRLLVVDSPTGEKFFLLHPGEGGLIVERVGGGMTIGVADAACTPGQEQSLPPDREALFVVQPDGRLYMEDGIDADAIMRRVRDRRPQPTSCPVP